MKILLITLITILFSGCNNTSMTPKEIAQAIKDCEDNGLEPKIIFDVLSYDVVKVVCYRKKDNQ